MAETEIQKLQQQMKDGAEETATYLEMLKTKLQEYDQHYKLSETASSYLQTGMDNVHNSVEELKKVGEKLKDKSVASTEPWVEMANTSLQRVSGSLAELKNHAIAYDEKVKSLVVSSVGTVKGGYDTARDSVTNSIETIVSSTRQKAVDGIELAQQQVQRVRDSLQQTATSAGHSAMVAAGGAVQRVESVDETYKISGTVTETVKGVAGRVMEMDQYYGVSEKAMQVDERITGGIGTRAVKKGVELVQQSVDYVSETLQQAKTAAKEAASPVKKLEDESTELEDESTESTESTDKTQ